MTTALLSVSAVDPEKKKAICHVSGDKGFKSRMTRDKFLLKQSKTVAAGSALRPKQIVVLHLSLKSDLFIKLR